MCPRGVVQHFVKDYQIIIVTLAIGPPASLTLELPSVEKSLADCKSGHGNAQ